MSKSENFCAVCECVIPEHDPRITVWICYDCKIFRPDEVAEIIMSLKSVKKGVNIRHIKSNSE